MRIQPFELQVKLDAWTTCRSQNRHATWDLNENGDIHQPLRRSTHPSVTDTDVYSSFFDLLWAKLIHKILNDNKKRKVLFNTWSRIQLSCLIGSLIQLKGLLSSLTNWIKYPSIQSFKLIPASKIYAYAHNLSDDVRLRTYIEIHYTKNEYGGEESVGKSCF